MKLIDVDDLPEPPYPSDARANGYPFNLDVTRAVNSDSWIMAPESVRPWMVMTWAMSWLQAPMGSWPNSDDIISARIGCPRKFFTENRGHIMRGWRVHSDGRLYHETITELATNILSRRDQWKTSKQRARGRKSGSQKKQNEKNQQLGHNVSRESRGSPASVSQESTHVMLCNVIPPSPSGDGACDDKSRQGGDFPNSRENGTNPRAQGTNPRATGSNPRSQGTNPGAQQTPRQQIERAFGPEKLATVVARLGLGVCPRGKSFEESKAWAIRKLEAPPE